MKDNKTARKRRTRLKFKSDYRPPKEKRSLSRGDVREDGLLFWEYSPSYRSGQRWVTRDKFNSLKKQIKEKRPPRTRVAETKEIRRFKTNLRSRVSHALGRNSKSASTEDLVGCTMDELRHHLESKFTDGMTWDNYGEWHVDHIKPCAMFDFSVDNHQFECFHYTNLQPLWAKDNYSKGKKYNANSLTAAEQVAELKAIGGSKAEIEACTNLKHRKELFRKLTKNKYEQ